VAPVAVNVLASVMTSDNEPTGVRVRAAGLVLGFAVQLRDSDVDRRLTELERRLAIVPGRVA
jgi:hypothetical protein